MATLITIAVLILLYIVLIQVGKTVEKVRELRGESGDYEKSGNINATLMMVFLVLFFAGIVYSAIYMWPKLLPASASDHGLKIEALFNLTLLLTGIVFIITHILLFWFTYIYRQQKGRKAYFFAHNSTLELVWSAIPAVTMAILVVWGIKVWFEIFPNHNDLPKNRIVIEATGKQFNWLIRYPGKDGVLGRRLITKENVSPTNELGIDFSDPASHDDFFASEIHMVKDRPVEFLLGALDVLHSFYLPHMRLKMDCVPGVPTGLSFTPIRSNDDTRDLLKENPDWQKIDPETNEPRWKNFKYELACAELCGKSHYGMQMNVFVESQKEYDAWMNAQKPIYAGAAKADTAATAVSPETMEMGKDSTVAPAIEAGNAVEASTANAKH